MEENVNEQQPESNEPTEVAPARKSGGSAVKLLLPILLLAAAAAGGWYFLQQQGIAAQNKSEGILKSLGVITIKDSSRKYVKTVTVPPSIDSQKISEVFSAIGSMKWIESLDAKGPSIGDAQMDDVAKLPRLSSLNLAETKVTDAGISKLTNLPSLESLTLRQTEITEAALEPISKFPMLRVLNISETEVHGKLETLNSLSSLSWLLLSELSIDDASVAELANNGSLSRLTIQGLQCDAASLQELKTARPDITIEEKTGQQ